jgi:tyrosyl-DNA phosphodiesterase 2
MTSGTIPAFAFDPSRGAWAKVREPPPVAPAPAAITLITWNVWFAPYSFDERFRALLAEVHARRPDVVCLQEITPESLALLLAEPWVRAHYRISDARGDTFEAYGVVILSRLPIRALEIHDLPSHMERRLLMAEIAGLVVGAVHLESMKNPETRAFQLAEIFPRLKAAGHDNVLCGDFNFCGSWADENANLDPAFVDLWPALHRRSPGYTQDTEVNAMLMNVKHKDKRVRYDRILLRSARGAWRARSIELLGTAPIAEGSPDVYPSDHFGLAAVLESGA